MIAGCSVAIARGVPLTAVAAQLGHRDAAMTTAVEPLHRSPAPPP